MRAHLDVISKRKIGDRMRVDRSERSVRIQCLRASFLSCGIVLCRSGVDAETVKVVEENTHALEPCVHALAVEWNDRIRCVAHYRDARAKVMWRAFDMDKWKVGVLRELLLQSFRLDKVWDNTREMRFEELQQLCIWIVLDLPEECGWKEERAGEGLVE